MLLIRQLRPHSPLFHLPKYHFKYLNSQPLPEDLLQLQQAALDFSKAKLLPHASEWDQKHHFPKDVLRDAAQQGFASIYVSTDAGTPLPYRP